MTEMTPTPTLDELPRRFSDFDTLGDALDYAAQGKRGFNFHDARGTLARAYPFRELREDALAAARRLIVAGIKPGDRVALIADTEPQFCALFFGAVYAGALPVPLPLPTSFGGRESYIDQIGVLRTAGMTLAARTRPIRRCRRRTAAILPICNIPAARPGSRTGLPFRTGHCCTISARTPMAC